MSRIVLFFRSFLLVIFVKECSRGPFCESLEKGRFRRDGSGRIPPDLLFVVLADGHN